MNLAPIKYRNFFNKNKTDGPFSKIEHAIIPAIEMYEAYVYLRENLVPEWKCKDLVFGNAIGCGNSKYLSTAYYKAISEALERWAFFQTYDSNDSSKFGFEVDPSTTGMAAFPSWSVKHVKEKSFYEAAEKWAVVNWWYNRLDHVPVVLDQKVKIFKINLPWKNITVVILYSFNDDYRFYFYGHGASKNIKLAIDNAFIELNRSERCLIEFYKSKINTILVEEIDSIFEKRLLYFSSPQKGHVDFLERIKRTTQKLPARTPRILVNEEIEGPWSQYAKVWRCLFESNFNQEANFSETCFLF